MASRKLDASPPFKGSAPPQSDTVVVSSGPILTSTLPQNGPAKSYMTSNSDIAGWNDAPSVKKAPTTQEGKTDQAALHQLFLDHLGHLASTLQSAPPLVQKMLDDAQQRLQPLLTKAVEAALPDDLARALLTIVTACRDKDDTKLKEVLKSTLPALMVEYAGHTKELLGVKRLVDVTLKSGTPETPGA